MSFLAPGFLALAAAASVAVIGLHFLARQQPRAAPFPTARFVPDLAARAPSRSTRPADLVLLLLRVLTVLLVGTAFARPVLDVGRRPVARIILVDRSRAVRAGAEVRDSARALLAAGDVMVLFDSTARVTRDGAADSLAAATPSGAPGSLSAALVAAAREAPEAARSADSLELVVVSPLAREEWDAATADLRHSWRGRARLVRVAGAEAGPASDVDARAGPGDPLRATLALMGRARAGGAVRLVRDRLSAADSAWARGGQVLVFWPADPAAAGWSGGSRDTVGAVVAQGAVVVAPFARVASPFAGRPSQGVHAPGVAPDPAAGRVVARWVDGEPAAVERRLGAGCERDVAVPIATEGDLALRTATQRFVAAMSAPCGGERQWAPLSDSLTGVLRGGGPLLPARLVPRREAQLVPASAWLLLAALLGLLAESAVRARQASGEPRPSEVA